MDVTAAAIAFFSLGANLLAGAVMFLLNPRNREVHWYIAFLSVMCLWLLAQGMDALDAGFSNWDLVLPAAVTMLPAVFLASALVERYRGVRWLHWVPVVVGAALVPVMVPLFFESGSSGWTGPLYSAWHALGWFGGSALLFRSPSQAPGGRRSEYLVTISLLIVVPVLVSLGMILGTHDFFVYVLPLLTVGVQLVVFRGIVRLRFYDIEVRAARSGELAAQTAAAERLALLGEVSATVAHEVRNPLTGMRSLAQRLAEEDVDDEKRRKYASVVLDEVGRLERMVNNLLAVARRTPPSYSSEPTSLDRLFEDLGLLVQSQAARRGVTLEMRAHGAVAAAPREALAQVLLNLLLNAITHAREGGRASVDARSDGQSVVIVVRDDGSGIPAAERERIFQPFNTRSDGGVGIGLSLVRRLADELGWQLAVDDAPGGGAEFRITVPALAGGAIESGEARRSARSTLEPAR